MSKVEGSSGSSEREQHPTRREREDASNHQSLSPVSVYIVVHREGVEELSRPLTSLWWSGVAAGIGISASVLAEGILHATFEGYPSQYALENLGYTVGFILVILGRLQLFTENTITAILPLLTQRSMQMLWCTVRLWTTVFVANLVGTLLSAILCIWIGVVPADYLDGMVAISRHFGDLSAYNAFAYGIPAGFFVAGIVWMLPSARASAIFVIMAFTYLIAMGGFTHVIAGSTELFLLLLSGETGLGHAVALLLSTLLGNIVGGTGLFALLAYGQVAGELDS